MSNICPFPQHAAHIAAAVAVTLAPNTSTPQQRLMAWVALKTARGETMHQHRLARMRVQPHDSEAIFHPALIGGAA